MPKLETKEAVPEKFYRALGLEVRWTGGANGYADCPECGGEEKLGVNAETGEYRCNKCGEYKGNMKTFLRDLWERSRNNGADYEELLAHRGLCDPLTLEKWGVVKNLLNGEWLVPGYGTDRRIHALYRYVLTGKKYALVALPGSTHMLHGVPLFDNKKGEVVIAEGVWDAMAVWETLRHQKKAGNVNVLAIPGSQIFRPEWSCFLADRKVTLLYDNDHPKEGKDGKVVPPAGFQGMVRLVQTLSRCDEKPKSVHYLAWGGRMKYNAELAPGFDVRDWLTQKDTLAERGPLLDNLLTMVRPVPRWWVTGQEPPETNGYHAGNGHPEDGDETSPEEPHETGEIGEPRLECLPCSSYRDLVQVWRKAMKWHPGMDAGLSVFLSCILSTECNGDQLWVKGISPPSGGKTSLCEALAVSPHTLSKSKIKGFHTGIKMDKNGTVDVSLIAKLKNKTLITKDGDTLLQSPNIQEILGEARDIYDRVARTDYRNGLTRNYVGHAMTWILCGTASLHALDSSELGERFLDVVLVDDMDMEMERDIADRKAFQAAKDLKRKSNCKLESTEAPEMIKAKQLTGGYVNHLRDNSEGMLDAVSDDEDEIIRCRELGEFVSFLRTKPSKTQKETVQRELCFRLTSQMVRLSGCLAAVLNKDSRDAEVMKRTEKVALDTCRGRHLEVVKVLHREGRTHGCGTARIAAFTSEPEGDIRQILQFLCKLGVTEVFTYTTATHPRGKPHYRLTPRLHDLYNRILGVDG